MPSDPLFITSPVFTQGGLIPAKYTCDAENISPPLVISGVPPATKSISIILTDLDTPDGVTIHWVIWNIPPVSQIEENYTTGVQGVNDFGRHVYVGPSAEAKHRYLFEVFAIDQAFNISQLLTGVNQLVHAMEGHILAKGEIMCTYQANNLQS